MLRRITLLILRRQQTNRMRTELLRPLQVCLRLIPISSSTEVVARGEALIRQVLPLVLRRLILMTNVTTDTLPTRLILLPIRLELLVHSMGIPTPRLIPTMVRLLLARTMKPSTVC